MTLQNRIATQADLPQIADLRWRLRVDDAPISGGDAYDRFVTDFVRICTAQWRPEEMVHWITVADNGIIAVMSVAIIRKLPSPENLHGRWGYICNSYVLPDARDTGVGQRLLTTITTWAQEQDLELLLVFPSERAYPFYERAGFDRPADPLVRRLRSE